MPGTTSIYVEKQWRDDDNRDGLRPQSIHVQLLANDKPYGDPIELSEENEWKHTWNDLPEKEAGVEIVYSVNEIDVPEGYGIMINGTPKEGFLIINPHEPDETEATVVKVWDDADDQDGIRPATITVQLMADNEAFGDPIELSESNNWTVTVTGLYLNNEGKPISYTWEEIDLPDGYTLTGNTCNGTVTTLTNTHTPKKVSVDGVKIWAGETDAKNQRPASVTIRLYADGVEVASVSVSANTDWKFKFEDLDKYKNGVEIEYTINEDPVVGYASAIDGYTVINTYDVPPPPPTSDGAVIPAIITAIASMLGIVFAVRRKRRVV